jgi:hypothetical protein
MWKPQLCCILEENGKENDKLGPGDTGNDSESNSDDSCEVMVPKLSKVNKILMKL